MAANTEKIQLTLDEAMKSARPQPFFNTVGLKGYDLKTAQRKVSAQEREILAFFLLHPGLFTPADVHTHFMQYPITSIRRAITNLTAAGHLEKTQETKIGEYGSINHCWRLKA